MAIQSLRREEGEIRKGKKEESEERRERGPVIFLKYCLNVSVWEGRLNLLLV